ncbi:hypothetical protein VTN31DRAFT_6594 [Thermomyces dupontii]|uniref:uncharacterized protein n=1 Tax=Talaromyces thermophilus TaxID=28565 RepID=UPI0037426069
MAATALLRRGICVACRCDGAQFFALSGISFSRSVQPPRRQFSIQSRRFDSGNSSAPTPQDEAEEKYGGSSSSSESIPWYLQVQPPTLGTKSVQQRQELPPVPDNSPAMLKDLLQFLSIDAGLDDLTLLDLRGRDPPPALGTNVIMIIGTARSLKHLNVSADRCCRWLRSTYKLRPHADGLLGRNELKIKLRRKARRAQAKSRLGLEADTTDDGITTGWICVNAGVVEDPQGRKQQPVKDEAFEGFGVSAGGTRIVVQMFTEERRAEINLEELWGSKRDNAEPINDAKESSPQDTSAIDTPENRAPSRSMSPDRSITSP